MVDVTKCIGCRKGVKLFVEREGEYFHFDLFATPAAGGSYKCGNSDVVKDMLYKNGDKGTLLPNKELEQFYQDQSFWWEDIVEISRKVFDSEGAYHEFFNEDLLRKSDEVIENRLLSLANKKNIKLDKEQYPDLIKWKDNDNS